jgi:hypothetical protein
VAIVAIPSSETDRIRRTFRPPLLKMTITIPSSDTDHIRHTSPPLLKALTVFNNDRSSEIGVGEESSVDKVTYLFVKGKENDRVNVV